MPRACLPALRLVAALGVFSAGFVFAAESDGSRDNYKEVHVQGASGAGTIRVREAVDPLSNAPPPASDGKYHPQDVFSSTSPMANKSFLSNEGPISKADNLPEDKGAFVTREFDVNAETHNESAPNLNTKAFVPATHAYGRAADNTMRSFEVASSDLSTKTAPESTLTSPDQGRTADVGNAKTESFADAFADKQYLGPGAQHVPDGIDIKENVVLSRMSTVPNRPLTVDEVRELINHGTTPDTGSKPDEPSKPLNDPGYQPKPLRDTPNPGADDSSTPPQVTLPSGPPTAADAGDDANGPVPSPGTMAAPPAPESAEPLPQK